MMLNNNDTPNPNTMLIAGREYEDSDTLKRRLQIKENALATAMRDAKFPGPIYIARRRWFDTERVDMWLLGQTTNTGRPLK